MSSPYRGHDPETPAGAEAALQEFSDALEAARIALRDARDAEVKAKDVFRKAKRTARFSPECPRAGTYDGVRVLKDDVDAWIDDQCADEELKYDLAKTARIEANELLRTLREQGIIQQSITKSVSQAVNMTRSGERW